MVEIERCKYLLPCGRCDKLGAPCEATTNKFKTPQEEFDEHQKKHCKHKWRLIGWGKSKNNDDILKYFYFCHNCGATFESDYKFEFK